MVNLYAIEPMFFVGLKDENVSHQITGKLLEIYESNFLEMDNHGVNCKVLSSVMTIKGYFVDFGQCLFT